MGWLRHSLFFPLSPEKEKVLNSPGVPLSPFLEFVLIPILHPFLRAAVFLNAVSSSVL